MEKYLNIQFKVRCDCLTYNHAPFIKDTFIGFCSQHTQFPFLCMIFDDDSSDGEKEVINNFLKDNFKILSEETTEDYFLTIAHHKENLNCYFAVFFLRYNHYSIGKTRTNYVKPEWKLIPYMALCEGDDYWTDPLKLQKQFDFMESHTSFSLYIHNALVHYESTDKEEHSQNNIPLGVYKGVKPDNIGLIPTASMFFRSKILCSKLYKECLKSPKILVVDVPLTLCCDVLGYIYNDSSIMSIYRIHPSNWTNTSYDKYHAYRFLKQDIELLRIFGEKYKTNIKQIIAKKSLNFYYLLKTKDFYKSFKVLFWCLRFSPLGSVKHLIKYPTKKIFKNKVSIGSFN